MEVNCKICQKRICYADAYKLAKGLKWHYKEKHKLLLSDEERRKYFLTPVEELDKITKGEVTCKLCKKKILGLNGLSSHYKKIHNIKFQGKTREQYNYPTPKEIKRIRDKARRSTEKSLEYHSEYKRTHKRKPIAKFEGEICIR